MQQRSAAFSSQNSSGLPFNPKALLAGAGALVAYGLSRRSKAGLALATAGGVLAFRAAKAQPSTPQTARATFLVSVEAQKAYDLWRHFENLPRFMAHLQAVRERDAQRSEWIATGPMDREVRWTAEITSDEPGKRITWRSLPGSDVQTAGSVEFRPDQHNRGTFVTAEVVYSAPGGSLGRGLVTLLGKHPQFMVREDLRRFKALLETGETPTTVGQTHGPRGIHGCVEQVLFRETSNHPQPQAA
ncbi:MAG TPA: SRPBCC family protein [Acidobacteriaceae bacterium]|jgi:uncharacterized membrane protein|nr:SRPBCC family protein [Acidobacteriaceae bacterium]